MNSWPTAVQCEELQTPHGRFKVWSLGEGAPLWCLHGFPDTPETFQGLMQPLADAGFQVFVPQMPGDSVENLQTDYRLDALADTLAMLLETRCPGEKVRLLGHDWGAALSCMLAIQRPQLIEQIVMCAVPHTRRFLQMNPAQLKRSWYMGFFQLPYWPERKIRAENFAFIEGLWRRWSPGWDFSDADVSPVKQAFSQSDVLAAALAYYRALPRSIGSSLMPGGSDGLATCSVPCLAIAGRQDGCIGPEMFAGQERYFSSDYHVAVLENAGHFMHREQPEAFLQAVLSFFR